MKIVYLISRAKKGAGPVNQALNILIGLNQIEGVHAVLMTLSQEVEGDSWLDRFLENNIEVKQLNLPIRSTWRAVRLLKQYIKKNHVDIVHSSGYRADFINMLLGGYVKTVSTLRNQPNESVEKFPGVFKKPFELLHLAIIKKIGTLVVCSNALKSIYENDYHIKVKVVSNCVDTSYFTPVDENKKKELRNVTGISEDKKKYLVLGRLSERKNVGMIINAFKSVASQDIQLVIVGCGPEEERLMQEACGDNRIMFLGKTGSPLNYLQASDVLISSSLSEGLPNAVLEALSCGLPCILSDIEPHIEILEGTNAGVIFDRFCVEELRGVINDSISWDCKKMSCAARDVAIEKYSVETLARGYVGIYREIGAESKWM